MKNQIKIRFVFSVLLAIIVISLNSCKKDSPDNTNNNNNNNNNNNTGNTTSGTVLLSDIIDNNPEDTDSTSSVSYGKPIMKLTYSGKQLVKSVIYFTNSIYRTDVFNYDSQGHLTGTVITYTGPTGTVPTGDAVDVSSTVTYSGSNIGEIKFLNDKSALYQDVTYQWQNGNITSLKNSPAPVADFDGYQYDYQYDGSNNNTGIAQSPDASLSETLSNFDSKNSITSAFPLWIYFSPDFGAIFMPSIPGAHNPTKVSYNAGGAFSYSYLYNSDNYPSQLTTTNTSNSSGSVSYKYDYIKVN